MLLFAKTSAGVSTDINGRDRKSRDGARRSSRFPCVCFAVCVLISVRCVQAADDIAMTAARIQAIGIELQKLDTPARASGLAYPARAVLPRDKEQLVSAAVAGMVDQILVEDHAEVVRGQPLIRINSPEFGDLQLKLLEATNQARLAAGTLAREKGLFAEGIIPKRRVIEAEFAASTARATEQHARAALRLAGADDATIARIAAGQVQDRLEIRASRAATVLAIDVKPGQRITEADPLLRLAELGTLWLDVDIPAAQADAWDPDGEIAVVGRDVRARPLSVSAQVSGAQMATLRASVTRGAGLLRPGEFLQAQVPLKASGAAWTLPNAAVVHQDDRTVVFVRTGAGFEARAVAVIAESAGGASVAGPLAAGDAIAVKGTIALKAAWLGESGAEDE